MTDMRIVKVVVEGKLPKSCNNCGLSTRHKTTIEIKRGCDVMNKWIEQPDTRPAWCPLVKQEDGEE